MRDSISSGRVVKGYIPDRKLFLKRQNIMVVSGCVDSQKDPTVKRKSR